MPEELKKSDQISKISLAKTMFNSFVDRSAAYNLPHAYGLIEFSTEPSQLLPIQLSVELFRDAVKDLKPNGDTSIYDAITLGCEMIAGYKGKRTKDCVSRILLLTDGIDTSSKVSSLAAVKKLLVKSKVHLDLITFGEDVSEKVTSRVFPGDKFLVKVEQDAIALSEM